MDPNMMPMPPPSTPPPTNGADCQIQTASGHAPGWPFDLPTFRMQVLPLLLNNCATSGCHASPQGNGGFIVWPDAAPGNCSYAKTFNNFISKVDLTNPPNSPVYFAVNGGDPMHPLVLQANDARLLTLLTFIQAAATNQAGPSAPPMMPPPPAANPFDYAVYQATIQPILDTAEMVGCALASCHGGPTGQGGLKLVPMPAPNSADMQANFNAVTALTNLATPEQSLIYIQATNRHASGASKIVSAMQGQAILDWIKKAQGNNGAMGGSGGTPPPTQPSSSCPSAQLFNQAVFQAEIQPILFGQVDLNNPGSPTVTTGCARATCHGADRTGGALVLKQTNSAASNLQAFACFVNLTDPVSSDILACPLNLASCRHAPHPGSTIFSGPLDKNYERILTYIYAAKTAATPLDFAFFARKVSPIFSDPSLGGAPNRSCGDCHGVAVAGQPAPNGSNFPVLADAGDKQRLLFNFGSASNFINFIQSTGSSLFLYPTDEVADPQNPFSTGLQHPGGFDFSPTSAPALAILAWAQGLRPDGQGFSGNWLVAGDYLTAAVTDPTGIDEANVKPTIFDPAGTSQYNNGLWDGLFSATATVVDLNAAFPRSTAIGRTAYASAFIINTTVSDIQAMITVTSPDAIRLYANGTALIQSTNASAGVSGLVTLPSFSSAKVTTHLLVKVFQPTTVPSFSFAVRFQDQFGNSLTNASGELVIKLSPDGGI
jgi:hypothetical protein